MNNGFGYNRPGSIKNFQCLRQVSLWAGYLGVVQSIIWIGLTITGIISYNCIISVHNTLSYGSVVQTIFLDIYFKGNCEPTSYPSGYDQTILKTVSTVLDPTQILIWTCVYLGVAVCWLLASVLLLTYVKKDDAKKTAGILYTWAIVTICITLMDLALGVIFGIDYGKYYTSAYNYNLNPADSGTVYAYAVELLAGMVAAISMMIISFKGFVLWIINFGLIVYLLMRAIHITSDTDGNDTLFMPRKESDDILTTRPPINAYDEQKSYNNEAFIAETRSVEVIELNPESIARAARMSTDASLQDRRFRNLDGFQQYPPQRYNSRQESVKQETVVAASITVDAFPAPDYSPPMSRANQGQPQNGLLRNQRYQ